MDQRAIGVFDSGLGGLTTVRELRRLLPEEHIIYFGDTGRVPYGSRGREIIRKYAVQDIRFLRRFDVKIIIAACGTVSSVITPEIVESAGVPFSGVVLPAAQAACAASTNGRIGVIGTAATLRSGAYGRAIRGIRPDAHTFGNACPLFVPLVENGFIQPDNEITIKVAQTYLQPMIENEVDTLILGCTHYPLLMDLIGEIMGPEVTLIDTGEEAAWELKRTLKAKNLLSDCAQEGTTTLYASDQPEDFGSMAKHFLQEELTSPVLQVNIDRY